MTNNETTNYENINGYKLSLKIDSDEGAPKSKIFAISYKNKKVGNSWLKTCLFLAVLFNAIAVFYVRTNITAIFVIIVSFLSIAFFWITHTVQSESLLVFPTIGVQSSVMYVYGREDSFIPWSSIDDVVINEVIKMNRVLYYLTILVKSNKQNDSEPNAVKLVPLFKYTKPKLAMIQRIYIELQLLLLESQAPGDKG